MTYSTRLSLLLATLSYGAPRHAPGAPDPAPAPAPAPLEDHLRPAFRAILDLADRFRSDPVTPAANCRFELLLQAALRELGRLAVQHTYNSLEPAAAAELPGHVAFEGTTYTSLGRKTPQQVWTLFGQVRLLRAGYRAPRAEGGACLFPLAHSLGLLHGATPALASHAGRLFAAAGMTQGLTRKRLREDNGVGWGVKKLRLFLAELARRLNPQRRRCQAESLLGLLAQAHASKGKNTPVLAVGRDGISLGIRARKACVFEVASTATVSVYDRSGKRLGTVYLAYAPEAEQARMSRELTWLIRAVLKGWGGKPLRLCYVTDAGQSETGYYKRTLAVMRHPVTRQRLKWQRVVDYYHASQRVWSMAEALFAVDQARKCWARKMLKLLLAPGGINRVLHSAAALAWRAKLGGKVKEGYEEAYRYLSRRMRYLRYSEYRGAGVPIGSGVTEAACKTVYTQRLKLSGMRWAGEKAGTRDGVGAQTVLDLRVLLLSGVWDDAFERSLHTSQVEIELTNHRPSQKLPGKVA